MKVVFLQDVEGTALVGEVKEVKNGFARNYLIPRGLAAPATKENLRYAKVLAEREARRQAKLDAEAQPIAERLAELELAIEARVGETGRLFGSVTNRDIAEAIAQKVGVTVDPHHILLPEPIRELGRRDVTIKLTRNVAATVHVEVVPDEASKAIVERLKAQEEAARLEAEKRKAEAEYAARAEQGRRAPAADDAADA
ncbi:MAG: 50S ribosomal protein L9 [Chloroflexota bacterium]|nr:50S ribosomal protein L9 [Dehalococcoidia bacterium]MDW8046373.1 50S ribosomal protein L9 [Chloroflexota bacterium]